MIFATRDTLAKLSNKQYLLINLLEAPLLAIILALIQTLLFVLVGNLLLEIEWRMILPFWFVLFTTSCFANVLGLNVSSAFNSAVTVYVMIPLLLIPQMILSGLLFSFDKLNDIISTKGKVPIVADLMASRWAYEALAVDQFKNNSFEKPYFTTEQFESQADFRSAYLVGELDRKRKFIADNLAEKGDSIKTLMLKDLRIIQKVARRDFFKKGLEQDLASDWTLQTFTPEFNTKLENYFAAYKKFYQDAYNRAVAARDAQVLKNEKE